MVGFCWGCRKIKMEGLLLSFAPPEKFCNTPGESLRMQLLTYLVKSPYVFIGYKQICMGKIVKEKLCRYFVINCVTIKRTYLSCGQLHCKKYCTLILSVCGCVRTEHEIILSVPIDSSLDIHLPENISSKSFCSLSESQDSRNTDTRL